MAQNRPITSAVQDIVGGFLRGQQSRLAREEEERRREALIDAAALKRQQDIDDTEGLAFNIEDALGLGKLSGPDRGLVNPAVRTTTGDISEQNILQDGSVAPSSAVPQRRRPGRIEGFTFTPKQRKAYARAVAMDPSVSGPILEFLSKANEFDLQEQANKQARNLRGALSIKSQTTQLSQQKAITKLIESGLYDQAEVDAFVNLSNQTDPELFDLVLEKMILDATDNKTLLEEETIKKKEARAEETKKREEARQQFTLSPGQERFDAQGKSIASVAPKAPDRLQIERKLDAAGITDPQTRSDIIVKSLTKPTVKVDINKGLDFKIPTGFQLVDKNDPTKGVTPIRGGPKDSLPGEQAAKIQMLRTAKKAFEGDKEKGIPGVRELVFDFDAKGNITGLDNLNLFNANFNIPIPFSDEPLLGIRGIPLSQGDLLRAKMELGIQAVTRGETGAAMPPAEVENTRIRFMPKVTDTLEIVKLKLNMFEDFINGTLNLVDPSGRFETDRFGNRVELNKFSSEKFDAELASRSGGGNTGQPQKTIIVDF